jgi:hypothetical protein
MYIQIFLILVLLRAEWSASRPGCFTIRRKVPWCPVDRRLSLAHKITNISKKNAEIKYPGIKHCVPNRLASMFRENFFLYSQWAILLEKNVCTYQFSQKEGKVSQYMKIKLNHIKWYKNWKFQDKSKFQLFNKNFLTEPL